MKKNICLVMQGSQNWLGGIEYISNLVHALDIYRREENIPINIFVLTRNNIGADRVKDLQKYADKIFFIEKEIKPASLRTRLSGFLQRKLFGSPYGSWRSFLEKNKIDFIYPFNTFSNRAVKIHSAAWIYDFQHKYLPQFFKKEEISGRDCYFSTIAKNSEKVVLSSISAQMDFKRFYPGESEKTHVLSFRSPCLEQWYEADPQEIQHKYNLPDRFLIVSNQFWQHKNHLVLFESLKILKDQGCCPFLVCTGQIYDDRTPDYCNQILQTVHTKGISGQVFLLGLIPKNDQIALLRRSIAVIQPSLFEGWSTIVENSRALGKTIILSDLPVHLEQNPPFAHYFKQNDSSDLARLLESIWTSGAPGPDLDREKNARDENKIHIREFGKQFMLIVNDKRK